MKIFFIYRYFSTTGGVERTLIDKANYLVRNGHDVSIVTFEQGNHSFAFEIDRNIKHYELNCRRFTLYKYPKIIRLFKLWQMNRLFIRRWNSLVKEQKPDVVVSTTNSGDFLREILTARDKTKIIVESHTAFIYDMGSRSILKKIWLARYIQIIKRCKMIISLTNGDAEFWRKQGFGNVCVVPNPLSSFPERICDVFKIPYRIIYVGRFDKVKRIPLLVEAFSLIAGKFPLWFIDIFGEGEECDAITKIIKRFKMEKRIIMKAPTNSIYEEYKRSQFLVLCSSYEGFGLVLIEAMANGIPCVSFDCPYGPREIIQDGVSGLLVKNGDVQDLAAKMEWLITHETERLLMGAEAKHVASQFRSDVIMKKWESAYCSIC